VRGEPGDGDWDELAGRFPELPGVRSVVVLEADRIADSCGYGVPLYEYAGDRTQLTAWAEKKGPEAVGRYQAEKNRTSIDGLPGLRGVESE
jgi:hypothetical protein